MKNSRTQSLISLGLILVIIVLVNMIANTWFQRIDLTDSKMFTLSRASKNVVGNLEEPMTVKVFASDEMSPILNDVKRYLIDMLSDYRAYSHGNFRFEVMDPVDDEELQQEASNYRIQPFRQEVWESDRLEVKVVYLGMVILYGDQQESISAIQSTSGLEYDITSRIRRITAQQERKVAFLQGHGEPVPMSELQQAMNMLEFNYQVTTVDLETEASIPDDISTLLIVRPTMEIPDEHKLIIDQFVMNGGSVGWFFGKVNTDLQNIQANVMPLRIDSWTENYGFRVNDDLVADMQSGMIQIMERRGPFTIPVPVQYPFLPLISEFSESNIISSEMEAVSMFFPSSIDTSLGVAAGVDVTPLLYSGPQSMLETQPFNINPWREYTRNDFNRAMIPLGAAIEGTFQSYFSDRDIPEDEEGNIVADADTLRMASPDSTRMVVVANGDFVRDEYTQNSLPNIYFLVNAVDWLVGDTELIQLRNREVVMRPLKDISSTAKEVWKYVNWFLPPVLLIFFGLVYWQVRRNTRVREV